MLRSLSDWFYRIASWKTLLLGIVLYVPFPAYFLKNLETEMNRLAGKTIGPIDLLIFNFDSQKILEMVADYGDKARAIYAQGEMTYDIAYPLIYTLLFCIILSLLYRNKRYAPFARVNILTVGALIADLLENTCIVTMLKSYPETSETTAWVCILFLNLKWGIFFAVIALIIYGLIWRLGRTPQPAH